MLETKTLQVWRRETTWMVRQAEGELIEKVFVAQPFFFFLAFLPSPSLSLVLSSLTLINYSLTKINLLFHSYYLIRTQISVFKPDFQVCTVAPFLTFTHSSSDRLHTGLNPVLSCYPHQITLDCSSPIRCVRDSVRKWCSCVHSVIRGKTNLFIPPSFFSTILPASQPTILFH